MVGIGDFVTFKVKSAKDEETGRTISLRGITEGNIQGWTYSKVTGSYGLVPIGTVSHLIVEIPSIGKGTWEQRYQGDPVADWNRCHESDVPHSRRVLIPIKDYKPSSNQRWGHCRRR